MTDYSYPLSQRIAGALRKSPVGEIKRCLEMAQKNALPVSATELEAHHLAGGRIADIIEALVLAKQKQVRLPFRRVCVQDLAFGKTRSVQNWVADCVARGVTDLEKEPLHA